MNIAATEARPRCAWCVPRVHHKLFSVLTLVALTTIFSANVRAGSTLSGQVEGTVVDQTGASVDGAWVVLFGAAGLEAQRSLTDQRGRFTQSPAHLESAL